MSVDNFVEWARNNDRKMKEIHYPDVKEIYSRKDIASKSGHSRGSTIDLTIIDKTGVELDMGTIYDFFGKSLGLTMMELQTCKNK